MLSLFCVVLCVLAQMINSVAQPAAILLRKRRVVDFIDVICRGTKSMERLQSCAQIRCGLISLPLFPTKSEPER